MKLDFRQGIARYQTDIGANSTFLQKSTAGNFIDLIVSPDPTIVVFAHKSANYLYEEVKTVKNAWGPFPVGGSTKYLYWDMSLIDATITRGFTDYPPVFSTVSPATPSIDQHWFDTATTTMKVWNGSKWVEKIRVFAAAYVNCAVIRPYPLGSQAGIQTPIDAGNIILDAYGKPLRMSDGTFATTATQLAVIGLATKQVKLEAEVLQLLAAEDIPRFSLVQVRPGRRAILAKNTSVTSRVAGIATEDLYKNEVGTIVTSGIIRSDSFSWPSSQVGSPLFCGPDGELITTANVTGVLQQVGQIWDTDAILVRIFPPVVLDDPFTIPPPPVTPPGAPIASFSSIPFIQPLPASTGNAPLTIQFQDTSSNSPTSLEWDFTNDGVVDSTSSNPTFTFATAGTYTVRLRATNTIGSTEVLKQVKVDPAPPSGTNVNLELTFISPAQVKRATAFSVSVNVRNEGLLTATNVARQLVIPNVGSQQVQLTSYPSGTTINRIGTLLYVDLPVVPTLASGDSASVTIGIMAVSTPNTNLVINGSVTSTETDSQIGDNTASVTVRIVP